MGSALNFVRLSTAKDLDNARRWWEAYGQTPMPDHLLTSTGFSVPGVCSIWLYLNESCLAWAEWFISNPEITPHIKLRGAKMLLDSVREYAYRRGVDVVISHTSEPTVIRATRHLGVQCTDECGVRTLFSIKV